MEILNRKTGLMEEIDDSHDAEWWRRPENAGELWVVKDQYREYRKIRPWCGYNDFVQVYQNSQRLRKAFGLLSIPSEDVWKELNRRKGRKSKTSRPQ